jgi:4-oxalocrotonate tautomerase
MPLLRVTLIEGRSPELKEQLIAALTSAAVNTLGVRAESVRVVLDEVPAAHWAIGGISKAQLEREASS